MLLSAMMNLINQYVSVLVMVMRMRKKAVRDYD